MSRGVEASRGRHPPWQFVHSSGQFVHSSGQFVHSWMNSARWVAVFPIHKTRCKQGSNKDPAREKTKAIFLKSSLRNSRFFFSQKLKPKTKKPTNTNCVCGRLFARSVLRSTAEVPAVIEATAIETVTVLTMRPQHYDRKPFSEGVRLALVSCREGSQMLSVPLGGNGHTLASFF